LEAIAHKCLEKAIHRRYASALDLEAELNRFLGEHPILARPLERDEQP
jgi:hypothetical protein